MPYRMLLIYALLITLGRSEEAQACRLDVLKALHAKNRTEITVRTSVDCPGYRAIVETTDRKRIFYRVNFSPWIVDNAPPMGFSIRTPETKDFESLGVDAHLRESTYNGIALDPKSKIDTDTRNRIRVRWIWKLRKDRRIEKIIFETPDEKSLLSHPSPEDCGLIHDAAQRAPDYGEKDQNEQISFETFNRWCLRQWRPEIENGLLQIPLDLKGALEAAQKEGRENIVTLLQRLNASKPNPVSQAESCRIDVSLLYPNHRLGEYRDRYTVKRIDGKIYKRDARGSITVPKGVYVIELLNDRMHGRSEPIECKGGKIHAKVYAVPHI